MFIFLFWAQQNVFFAAMWFARTATSSSWINQNDTDVGNKRQFDLLNDILIPKRWLNYSCPSQHLSRPSFPGDCGHIDRLLWSILYVKHNRCWPRLPRNEVELIQRNTKQAARDSIHIIWRTKDESNPQTAGIHISPTSKNQKHIRPILSDATLPLYEGGAPPEKSNPPSIGALPAPNAN